MSEAQQSHFCPACNAQRIFKKNETFSTGLGCLLVVLTGGLFIPLWILGKIADASKPWLCQQCGSQKPK